MSAEKFNADRAADYDRQARIALAGYEAMHELTGGLLRAALGPDTERSLLIAGIGTGQEVLVMAPEAPRWRFVAADPSPAMIEIAQARLAERGLLDRTTLVAAEVAGLPPDRHDGATLIGVLHHLKGDHAKQAILAAIAERLHRGAPFVLAGNCGDYQAEPLLLAAWRDRWRSHGVPEADIEAKFARITRDVDPPRSEAAVQALLATAGFGPPRRVFSSLFWGTWLAYRC